MARKKRCCINVKDVASESEDKECGINCGFILFYFFFAKTISILVFNLSRGFIEMFIKCPNLPSN